MQKHEGRRAREKDGVKKNLLQRGGLVRIMMRRGVGGQAGQSSSGEEDKREEGEGGGYCSRSTPPLWGVKKNHV